MSGRSNVVFWLESRGLAGDRRDRRSHLRRGQGVEPDADPRADREPDWRRSADKAWHPSAADRPSAATRLLTRARPPRAIPRTYETRSDAGINSAWERDRGTEGVRRAWLGYRSDFCRMVRMQLGRRSMSRRSRDVTKSRSLPSHAVLDGHRIASAHRDRSSSTPRGSVLRRRENPVRDRRRLSGPRPGGRTAGHPHRHRRAPRADSRRAQGTDARRGPRPADWRPDRAGRARDARAVHAGRCADACRVRVHGAGSHTPAPRQTIGADADSRLRRDGGRAVEGREIRRGNPSRDSVEPARRSVRVRAPVRLLDGALLQAD